MQYTLPKSRSLFQKNFPWWCWRRLICWDVRPCRELEPEVCTTTFLWNIENSQCTRRNIPEALKLNLHHHDNHKLRNNDSFHFLHFSPHLPTPSGERHVDMLFDFYTIKRLLFRIGQCSNRTFPVPMLSWMPSMLDKVLFSKRKARPIVSDHYAIGSQELELLSELSTVRRVWSASACAYP